MQSLECPWCGQWTNLIYIQSHYACDNCKRPVMDCCDGEQAQIKGQMATKPSDLNTSNDHKGVNGHKNHTTKE